MTIKLSPELAELVPKQVKAGRFASPNEAVNLVVDFVCFEHSNNPGALRALIDEGLADLDAGRFSEYTAEEVIAECRKRHGAKRKR